jgi:hypothetical protein
MPDNATALLGMVFAFLPGFPAEQLYRMQRGSDWREKDWQRWLRLLVFSLVGLATYALLAKQLGAPPPIYVSPQLLSLALATPDTLADVLIPLLGHTVAAVGIGLLAGLVLPIVSRRIGFSPFSGAWDQLAFSAARSHWVVIGLQNGESYAGIIDTVDTSVAIGERDVLLADPAAYAPERRDYIATGYKYLFLPGDQIASVGILYDPDIDEPTTAQGKSPFPKEGHDG